MRLNRYNAQIMSIFIFLVGAFLVSGPLLFPWIYKVFMAVIPGLSEVRAVGRGGLLVNLAYAISIFVLLNKFPKKTNQDRTLFLFICLLLVSERYTLDFPTRVTHYQLPANIEANKLINDSLGFFIISAKPSVFVITETIEDFIRIPFYLSIETHLKSVNGYSGYNPKEWNHTAMLFKKGLNCSSVKTKNTYLFENANFILIEKISPFYMECGKGLLRNYQLVASSKNYSLFQGSILIK